MWVDGETLTLEYATDTLAQYRVAVEADGRRLKEIDEPRFFATGHASPQPFLAPLGEVVWHPAQRLTPYRARRRRSGEGQQERLFDVESEAGVG